MSRATHFVGTAGLPQEADPPADGRRFRVGPQADPVLSNECGGSNAGSWQRHPASVARAGSFRIFVKYDFSGLYSGSPL